MKNTSAAPAEPIHSCRATVVLGLVTAGLVALLPVGEVAAQANNITLRSFGNSGNWKVQGVFNRGAFDHCSATANYKSGTNVSIIARSTGVWTLSFRHPSWPERTGQTFAATLVVDGRNVLSGQGRYSGRSAIIDLGTSADRVVAIMKGSRMTVRTPSGSSAFSLLGTRDATVMTARCWTTLRSGGSSGGAFGGGAPKAGGGAFGGGGTTGAPGAFGAAPPPTPAGATRLSRSATLELATRYLSSAKEAYEILPEERNILKSYPVNWRYRSGIVGGMMAFSGRTVSAEQAMSKLLANRATNCKGRHATERMPSTNNNGMTTNKAVSACEVNGTVVKEVLTAARFTSGALLIVLEAKADRSGGPAQSVPLPGPSAPRKPAPNEL